MKLCKEVGLLDTAYTNIDCLLTPLDDDRLKSRMHIYIAYELHLMGQKNLHGHCR